MSLTAKTLTGLTWSNALGWAISHWKDIFSALLVVTVVGKTIEARHYHRAYTNCTALRKADKAAYEDAQKSAAVKNKAEVQAAETLWKAAGVKVAGEYDDKLKTAYAAVARYANGVRSQTTPRPTGVGGVPQAPRATEGSDGPGSGALIPVPTGDLNVCAENTIKAQEWQEYWKSVVANWPQSK